MECGFINSRSITAMVAVHIVLATHVHVRASFLSDGIDQARAVIVAEQENVRDRKNKDTKHNSATARADSFLSSNPRIKELSGCAIAQEIAIRECMIQNSRFDCPKFWKKLTAEKICGELGLTGNNHPGGASCPGDECPFIEPTCDAQARFRTIDGTCNDLERPLVGSANRALARFLTPDYEDCVGTPRSVEGGLPSARAISNVIFQSDVLPLSTILTNMHMTFGQLVDHDLDLTPVSKFLDPDTGMLVDVQCGDDECSTEGLENINCFPIAVPDDDPKFDDPCMKLVRSETVPIDDCGPSPRQQSNAITSFMDTSFVYSSSDETAAQLRTFQDGLLISIEHPFNADFKPLLPPQIDSSCRNVTDTVHCFLAGDTRQNEQVALQALHTVFMRYHNYIAGQLKERHADWDDERLYQESRRILNAVFTNTVYNEYLPPLLGSTFMTAFDLFPKPPTKYFKRYNAKRYNPDTANVFSTAAFRFGHSQVSKRLRFADPTLNHIEDVIFSGVAFNPNRIFFSGILDNEISGVNAVMIGQTDQMADAADGTFTKQIAGSLFTDFLPSGPGSDLPARNTQRGRDHGIPAYVEWIKWCNDEVLSKYDLEAYTQTVPVDFDDLIGVMPQAKIDKLKQVYNDVSDVDLFTGAMLENHVLGGVVGPTFACILAKQFRHYKYGDRFYFETNDQDLRFTKPQLDNIREQTIASILCKTLEDDPDDPDMMLTFQKRVLLTSQNNAIDNLDAAQVSADEKAAKLEHYHGDANERLPCSDHAELDFSLF